MTTDDDLFEDDPLRLRLTRLAEDVGRLRRRLEPGSANAHLGDRIADHVSWLAAMTAPCAAELFREFFLIAGDQSETVEEALALAERRFARIERLLSQGEKSAALGAGSGVASPRPTVRSERRAEAAA